jgi:DHA1 family multidrug resistance protein-like MFS transporter
LGGAVADRWGYRVPFLVSGGLLLTGGLIIVAFVHENAAPAVEGVGSNRGLRHAFGGKGLVALMGVFFFISLSMSFAGPIFPLFVERIAGSAKSATITGMLMAVSGIAAGLSAAAVGRVGDRFGHKRVLVACAGLTGVVSGLHALARTVAHLFGLRVAAGLSAGGTTPTLNAIIATSVSPDMYGRAYGLSQSGSGLGWATGPLIGGLVASAAGLRCPFVIMGCLLLWSAALVAAFARPRARA